MQMIMDNFSSLAWQDLLSYLRKTPLKKQMKYKGKDKKFFEAAKAVYQRKVGFDVWVSRN